MSGRLFLTDDELRELTGYVRPSCQVRWLRHHGIRHFVARDGHPRVPRCEIERSAPAVRTSAPDFSVLEARG